MFDKILIANRGEIACRVIKTARRLGIRTVAVYSTADANARHVRLADEAVLIGPADARESYLVIEKIIAAAQRTGAQAIHPGYGFLSENEAFCRACEAAGLVFIGPPVAAIQAMGSKSEAKKRMEAAGVSLTPGYHGDDQEPERLRAAARTIGYPVLIKASAGGGGKGMRLVEQDNDFLAGLASCQREARASFGDAHVLIEKYIVRPRHIEIQVFADSHGQCISLFERDCSVQRRHQKVLEEAPAPGMTPERRAAMGQAAVEAARAVGYIGAGTVEFIAHQDGTFYFMEMNTRLQVEHPITEMITGLDLVEWQLRIAAGEPLPLTQDQLQITGHALEARIYAEDPDKGFLPSTGPLLHLRTPIESRQVRIDTGVEAGDTITPYYDPMIAKLIVWDRDRTSALARMREALAGYQIVGVANNVDFLSRLVSTPAFMQADLDTGLIEREHTSLFPTHRAVPETVVLLAALAELLREAANARHTAAASTTPDSPWHQRDGWRLNLPAQRTLCFEADSAVHAISVSYLDGGYRLSSGTRSVIAHGHYDSHGQLSAEFDGQHLSATVIAQQARRHIFFADYRGALTLIDPLAHSGTTTAAEAGLLAPMPGKIIALLCAPGETVVSGTGLLILEAMKMEHTIRAPADGTLKAFHYAVGDQVSDGVELVDFELAPA